MSRKIGGRKTDLQTEGGAVAVKIIPRAQAVSMPTFPWSEQECSWEAFEQRVADDVEIAILEYNGPIYPEEPIGDQKWNLVSQLQKAIRRGQVTKAVQCAQVLASVDRNYVVYRMSVIVAEEIGVANIPLNCMWLWAARQRVAWWNDRGPRRVCGMFAQWMAESVKSREAADVLNATENWPEYAALRTKFKACPIPKLSEYTNHDDPMVSLQAATSLLLRGRAEKQPKQGLKDHWHAVMNSKHVGEIPLSVQYATWWGLRKHREWQPATIPWVWRLHTESSTLAIVKDVDVSRVIALGPVGAYESEALDKHTRDGKRAIAYFNAMSGLRDLYAEWGITDKVEVTGTALFRLEGDRVDRRLYRDGSDELNRRGVVGILFGLLGHDEKRANEVLDTIWENRSKLQHARLRIMNLDS